MAKTFHFNESKIKFEPVIDHPHQPNRIHLTWPTSEEAQDWIRGIPHPWDMGWPYDFLENYQFDVWCNGMTYTKMFMEAHQPSSPHVTLVQAWGGYVIRF